MDLAALSDIELDGVIEEFPWFAAARIEFVRRSRTYGEDAALVAAKSAGLFVMDRRTLHAVATGRKIAAATRPLPAGQPKPSYVVVGGDYFGKEDFKALEDSGEAFDISALTYNPLECALVNTGASPAAKSSGPAEGSSADPAADENFCTETLAGIYFDQELYDDAISAYEKLILLYPEKSAYFASLIEKVKENKNQ